MMPGDFHFLRPAWLLALVPLPYLLWRLARRRQGNWAAVCDPALLPHLLLPAGGRRRWPLAAAALAGLLTVLALAGPVWRRQPQPAYEDRSGLVVVLDLSAAIDAADLKPSRLARARFEIADLLSARREGQTALVVYAGDAFTVTPLTTDTGTIASQLGVLDSALMPAPGSRTDLSLARAAALLRQGGLRSGDVLLLTAGSDAEADKTLAAARQLRQDGYRLSVLGVGTPEGAPIPLAGGGFLQQAGERIALSSLPESALQQLAATGGGIYRRLRADDGDLQALLAFFSHHGGDATQESASQHLDVWQEEGPWLLLPLLLLAPLAFRRGVLGLLFCLLLLPRPAQALDWQGLWSRPDRQASRALARGETAPDTEVFRDPAWKGAALYRAGRYQEALQALEHADGAETGYNRGNALARLGRYAEAAAAYRQALEADPENEDARHNLELVEKQLQKQKDQQPQEKSDPSAESASKDGPPQDGKKGGDKTSAADKDNSQSGDEEKQTESAPDDDEQKAGQDDARQQAGQPQPSPAGEKAESMGEKQDAADIAQEPADETQADAAPSDQLDRRPDEQAQAQEQWLRQIPDDPGGLLRRKFLYQYRQKH